MSRNLLGRCSDSFFVLRGLAMVPVIISLLGGLHGRLAAEDNSAFDLKYVGDKGGMVIAVRPERIFSDAKIKPLAKVLDETGRFRSALNFSVARIDQFVMAVIPPEEREVPHMMIKARDKIDLEKFIRLNQPLQPDHELKQVEHRGKTYTTCEADRFGGPLTIAYWQPDENSVVVGTVEHIENCIAGHAAKKQLLDVDQWSKVEKSPLAIAVDNSLLKAIAKDLGEFGDEPIAKLVAPLAEHVKYVVGSVNVGKRIEFLALVECESVDGAKDTSETIQALLTIAKSFAQQSKEALGDVGPLGEIQAKMLEMATQLIDAVEITRQGKELKIVSTIEFKAFVVSAIDTAVASAQMAAKRAQSMNNMKQMGLGFHNYADVNKRFPPAVIVGSNGDKHSWRVAILPYIGEQKLFEQYRFDEPWDSKENLKVLAQMPEAFRHPDDPADSTNTAYYALVGPGTMFDSEKPVWFPDVTDGTSNTIMYVEAKRAVPWTKPEDIPYDPKGELPDLGGYFPDGFNATFGDGSVRFFSKDVDPLELHKMIQISDGQILKDP